MKNPEPVEIWIYAGGFAYEVLENDGCFVIFKGSSGRIKRRLKDWHRDFDFPSWSKGAKNEH
tara:strand:+ start:206 stop:391 length:186 start_codon:yes stop_codon:yes gene_type:complete